MTPGSLRAQLILRFLTTLIILSVLPASAASPVRPVVAPPSYLTAGQFDNLEPVSIEGKIRKAFPENPETMLAIAKCESGLNQEAVSHTRDFGVFQINEKIWNHVADDMGLDYKGDIDDNINMARHVYDVQGVSAWVCYTKRLI